MLVATPDPALLSALDAAFSPRGVRVAMADRPLRATSDDPGAGARGADLVWLCDVTPAPAAAPSSPGTAPPATALCVRPHQGTVIIRRVAVATPLSPEDAAALALSVQVALMPGAAPAPVTIASSAPAVEPTRADSAGSGGTHGLTLELSGGFRGGPAGKSSRASLSAVYAPGAFEHRFGVGAALGVGSTSLNDGTTVRGPGPPALPVVERNRDLTFRLFARAPGEHGADLGYSSTSVRLLMRRTALLASPRARTIAGSSGRWTASSARWSRSDRSSPACARAASSP